ncbi:MAG: hypothetical protein KJ072_07310 [Verrucomicrobia bacterium]|nr:hypothetical protein [Verrucomicrobiota bacterium]
MSLGYGSVLRCSEAPRHLWIILSKPEETDGKILFANFTAAYEDDGLVIGPQDFPRVLTKPSTIAFGRSHGPVLLCDLEAAVQKGCFSPIQQPIPILTLTRIIEAAHRSDLLSPAKKRLLPHHAPES